MSENWVATSVKTFKRKTLVFTVKFYITLPSALKKIALKTVKFQQIMIQAADLESRWNVYLIKVRKWFFLIERRKNALNLKTISAEKPLINYFSSNNFETTELDKVCINFSEKFSIEVLYKPCISLSITNQPVKYSKINFEFLRELNLAGSGTMNEIC